MHALEVQTEFAAAHAIVIRGEREPLHGHNWRVLARVEGAELDADGLLCDFHLVETALRDVVNPYHNRNLNETPPFNRINPTAERVAEHLFRKLSDVLAGGLPGGVRVARVSVSEAPGCVAVHEAPLKEAAS